MTRLERWATFCAGMLLGSCTRPVPPPAAPTPPALVIVAPPPPPRVIRITRPDADESPVFGVQIDQTRVYFNDGAGRLWAAPKDGSAAATAIVDDPHDSVRSFFVAGDAVYYAARHQVRMVPTDGGPTERLAESKAGPILVVGDGQALYHTVFDGSATYRLSLATHRDERFCGGGKHHTLAVDDQNLYIASYFGGTISAVSKKTKRSRVLAANVRHPVRLIVDGEYVYFTSESDGAVRRVPKVGGRVETLASGQRDQEHLALDADSIYWTSRTKEGTHALMRSSHEAGGSPEILYDGLRSGGGLAVDADYVYVADRGAGEVLRVRKQP